jgi:branched-chain amino acid transport system substrate-binding protein
MARNQSRSLASLSAAMLLAMSAGANAAISDNVVKLGLLSDLSGTLSTVGGTGAVLAVQMAVEDLKSELGNLKVEVVSADHQNKADVGDTIARRWFDVEKVDAIFDVGNSSIGLALQSLIREKNKPVFYSSVGTTELTGAQCAKSGFSWLHDSYALVSGSARSLTAAGMDTWFFIAADYAFGKNMVEETLRVLKEVGGKSVGQAYHPIGSNDYSSYLMQAQASKAKVVAFANGGQQLVTAMKQWKEFGMQGGPQIPIAQLMFLVDAHGMGLDVAQGIQAVAPWYWELNEGSKAFGRRFFARHKAMPTGAQASMYSAARHYLKAILATGSDDTDTVVKQMRATPVDDFYANKAMIREDGKLMHDFYLIKVRDAKKIPEPWAYYDIVRTIPSAEAYQPLSASACPFVKEKK